MEDPVIRLEAALAASIGRQKALEYAIRALITADPDPQRFEAAWQALLPTIADVHSELPSDGIPQFRQSFQAGLALVTETAHMAVQASQKKPQR